MKSKNSIKLIIAGLVGCSLCALPLLLPAAAGALGISIISFSLSQILSGLLFLFVAIGAYALYLSKTKKAKRVINTE